MEIILAIAIGILYAVSVYLLLRRSIVKLILGIIFLSNATNLLLFTAGGLSYGSPALIKNGHIESSIADPLPQALILTAIVIGFGLIAFTLVLTYTYYKATGTEDLDEVKRTDKFK